MAADLAGDAEVAERVGPVGVGLEVEDEVAVPLLDRFGDEADHGQLVEELLAGEVDGDVFAEPIQTDLHFGPELPEEPQVVLVEIAHLGDAEGEHGRAVDAQPEGPAGVFLRVDVDVLEDLGVDHARAQDLLPARPAADAAGRVLRPSRRCTRCRPRPRAR